MAPKMPGALKSEPLTMFSHVAEREHAAVIEVIYLRMRGFVRITHQIARVLKNGLLFPGVLRETELGTEVPPGWELERDSMPPGSF